MKPTRYRGRTGGGLTYLPLPGEAETNKLPDPHPDLVGLIDRRARALESKGDHLGALKLRLSLVQED